jgi:hypothetical protein
MLSAKKKSLLRPLHPQMTQPNLCPPAWIWEIISLMWSVRLGLKAPHSLRQIQRYQRVTTSTREIFPPRVENMDLTCFCLLIVENNWLLKFWTTHYFWIYCNIFLKIISIIIDINCQNMKVMMGFTRMDIFLIN